ncbi:hypothetical protein [Mesorhizobium sp.]|uniref:hypothetical protein n=2 Tax=Mesorhizobium sp. TaxID=1871066 RepID=UPI000FE82C22|nr:hypothetical protein [Mesorhizobium sp.]RWF99695.1 MAG: hypothetical protein EOQ54_28705 [Mesorhizobium sp.]RWG94300.1 MAG: hypothetical protein EOQ72_27850 [Mesorhizobium sp.]
MTTALFIQSGTQTATILSCLPHGDLFCLKPDQDPSVIDIQALLILLNFSVVFWFAYRALGEALQRSGQISLDVKIIGLGTAFLSSLDIYGYALKNHVPERLVFALPVIFFVFVVPFVLMHKVGSGEDPDDGREITSQAYSALRQVVVSLVACVAATIAGSLYSALLNDGLHLVTHDVWVFNPAALGMGWLVVLCMSLRSDGSNADIMPLAVTASGFRVLLIAPLLMNAAIAVFMISNDNIAGPVASTSRHWQFVFAKACVGAGLTFAFMAAFFMSRRVGFRGKSAVSGILSFAAVGALCGLAVAGLRNLFGAMPHWNGLAGLHAAGFVISYLAGVSALHFMRRSFPELTIGEPNTPQPKLEVET